MNFKETFLNTVIRSWPQLIKGFSPFFDLIHLERGMKLFSLQDITYVWRGKEESFINGLKSSYSRLVYLQGYNANRWFANENFDRVYLINGIYCGDRGALLRFRINMHSQRSRDCLYNFRPLKKLEKFQKSINATGRSNIDPAIIPVLPVHHCMFI
jgi:hypothetical protein